MTKGTNRRQRIRAYAREHGVNYTQAATELERARARDASEKRNLSFLDLFAGAATGPSIGTMLSQIAPAVTDRDAVTEEERQAVRDSLRANGFGEVEPTGYVRRGDRVLPVLNVEVEVGTERPQYLGDPEEHAFLADVGTLTHAIVETYPWGGKVDHTPRGRMDPQSDTYDAEYDARVRAEAHRNVGHYMAQLEASDQERALQLIADGLSTPADIAAAHAILDRIDITHVQPGWVTTLSRAVLDAGFIPCQSISLAGVHDKKVSPIPGIEAYLDVPGVRAIGGLMPDAEHDQVTFAGDTFRSRSGISNIADLLDEEELRFKERMLGSLERTAASMTPVGVSTNTVALTAASSYDLPVGTVVKRTRPFVNCLVKTTANTWAAIWPVLDPEEIEHMLAHKVNTLSPGPDGDGWTVILPDDLAPHLGAPGSSRDDFDPDAE